MRAENLTPRGEAALYKRYPAWFCTATFYCLSMLFYLWLWWIKASQVWFNCINYLYSKLAVEEPMSNRFLLICLFGVVGCTDNKYSLIEQAQCDGDLQSEEEEVDDLFDRDGDGYFDGLNPDCESTYGPELLDCDDANPDINPGTVEVECDDLDNDCNEETPDSFDNDEDGVLSCDDCDDEDASLTTGLGVDLDEDGVSACLDCDDQDPANFPGNLEICDGQDNNCNDEEDELEECTSFEDYSGTWVVTPAVSYACAFNSVTLNLSALEVTDVNPVILFSGLAGTQPGSMSGTIESDDSFFATNVISSGGAGCDETYSLSGSFTSDSEFEAIFTAEFYDASGTGLGCFDCVDQTFTVVGIR